MDLVKQFEQFKLLTDELIRSHPPDDIYFFLRNSEYILPDGQIWRENIRSNVPKQENDYLKLFKAYSIRAISYVVSNGVASGKINIDTLTQHLREHSWLGQDTRFTTETGELDGYNWIDILSPSLALFIEDFRKEISSEGKKPEKYIVSTDSLGIKFEGLIREVCRINGSQISEKKLFQSEKLLTLEQLLAEPDLKQLYIGNDLAFLEMAFSEKGMNLAGNLSRSYYLNTNYTLGTALILFFALLKVANLKFRLEN